MFLLSILFSLRTLAGEMPSRSAAMVAGAVRMTWAVAGSRHQWAGRKLGLHSLRRASRVSRMVAPGGRAQVGLVGASPHAPATRR